MYIHMYTHVYTFFFIYRLLLDIEYSFLFHTVGPFRLSVFTCSALYLLIPHLSLPAFPFSNDTFVFYVCVSVSVLSISKFESYFRFHM